METASWRQVRDWNYEVSDGGEIRRRTAASGTRIGLVLKVHEDPNGYVRVPLYIDAKRKSLLLHRLVLEAFVGPCPPGHNANHKNGCKTDNRLENLEWVTRSENQLHAFRTGLQGVGEKHGMAKLTDEQVRTIRLEYTGQFGEQTATAKKYGVSQNLISKIVRGDVWQNIDPPRAAVFCAERERGEGHGRAKLTDEAVADIRQRYAAGEDKYSLAARYGVSHQIVRNIALRRSWQHVA